MFTALGLPQTAITLDSCLSRVTPASLLGEGTSGLAETLITTSAGLLHKMATEAAAGEPLPPLGTQAEAGAMFFFARQGDDRERESVSRMLPIVRIIGCQSPSNREAMKKLDHVRPFHEARK